jgi:hypothetical protein
MEDRERRGGGGSPQENGLLDSRSSFSDTSWVTRSTDFGCSNFLDLLIPSTSPFPPLLSYPPLLPLSWPPFTTLPSTLPSPPHDLPYSCKTFFAIILHRHKNRSHMAPAFHVNQVIEEGYKMGMEILFSLRKVQPKIIPPVRKMKNKNFVIPKNEKHLKKKQLRKFLTFLKRRIFRT